MSEKPLPCPFCGSEDLECSSTEDSKLFVHCLGCGAGIMAGHPEGDGGDEDDNGLTATDRAQCFAAWNTRPPLPAPAVMMVSPNPGSLWGDGLPKPLLNQASHKIKPEQAQAIQDLFEAGKRNIVKHQEAAVETPLGEAVIAALDALSNVSDAMTQEELDACFAAYQKLGAASPAVETVNDKLREALIKAHQLVHVGLGPYTAPNCCYIGQAIAFTPTVPSDDEADCTCMDQPIQLHGMAYHADDCPCGMPKV